MSDEIDFKLYNDLPSRFASFSTDGGDRLAGTSDDVTIVDAEPEMRAGEEEIRRLFGMIGITGSFKEEGSSEDTFALGGIAQGPSVLIVTNRRLIVMMVEGVSRLGQIAQGDEVHVFALPFDLIDSITMKKKKKISDRVAGNRVMKFASYGVIIVLEFLPAFAQASDGSSLKVSDDEVFASIVNAVLTDRLEKSPADDHERLNALLRGEFPIEDGEYSVDATPDFEGEIPPHLDGRVKLHA